MKFRALTLRTTVWFLLLASMLRLSCGAFGAPAKKPPTSSADKMSAMGRLAHALAQARAAQSNAVAQVKRHRLSKSFPPNGEGGDEDGPGGGQAELSIAVDSTGQHIVVGYNDSRGFALNLLSVSGLP